MLLHRPGLLQWIWTALFGPLAADGDSTGGSNAAATPQPADGTFLAQKGQESATERHYSGTANVQTKNRGSMKPRSMESRCLFRGEVLQEIAALGNANNHGLQTVDEAAEDDEAAEP